MRCAGFPSLLLLVSSGGVLKVLGFCEILIIEMVQLLEFAAANIFEVLVLVFILLKVGDL